MRTAASLVATACVAALAVACEPEAPKVVYEYPKARGPEWDSGPGGGSGSHEASHEGSHTGPGSGSGASPGCLPLPSASLAPLTALPASFRMTAASLPHVAPAHAPEVPAAPPVAAPAAPKPRCDPPYFYDGAGMRIFKEECL